MNTWNLVKNIQLILIIILISGCTTNLTPIQVSERFWTAVKDNNPNEVKKYIATGTLSDDTQENLLPLEEVQLGRTVIDVEQAWVDTTVIIEGDETFELPLKTVLLKENGQWKVDYNATVATLSRDSSVAKVIGSIAELGGQFADELDRSLEDIQKAIPKVQKEIERIEDNVKEHLPEIQRRMDEFIQQLEKALEDLKNDTEQRGTTEI